MNLRFVFLSLVMMSPVSSLVFGQTPDAGALQRQYRTEVDRDRPVILPEPLIKNPDAPTSSDDKNQGVVNVRSFTVVGLTLITPEQAQAALAPYCNRTLSINQIKEAANTVTNLYNRIGRVARAIVPAQDVTSGNIEIKIIEGKMGEVKVDFDKVNPSRLKPSLISEYIYVRNSQGDLIDLTALERGLGLLNETPGNQVSGDLAPGLQEGSVDLVINAKDTGLFVGDIEFSNYGSANTGVGQVLASLNLNNPSGNADQASLDVVGSLGSVYSQMKYALPLGYDGWRVAAGVGLFDYKTLSSFSSAQNMAQGSAQIYGLYATYALERGVQSNKDLTIVYENKIYSNKNSYTGLEFQNYQINDLSVGIRGTNVLGQNYLTWSGALTGGYLSINNDAQAATNSGALTKGNFAKLNFNTSLSTPITVLPLNIVTSLYGQIANKNLNTSEQFYLGGPYGVRAYPVAQGGGAQGAIASIEINHSYQNQWQFGAFFDAGIIEQYKTLYSGWQGNTNAGNTYSLFAMGPVLRYVYEKVQVSAAAAFRIGSNPLYNSAGQQLNVDNRYNAVQAWVKGTVYF